MINPEMTLSSESVTAPARKTAARTNEALKVSVVDSITAARESWQHLEAHGLLTAYQRFDWIAAWQRHIGDAQNVQPRVVIVEKAGDPVMILPLGMTVGLLGGVIRFLGGTHANYNLGIFDKTFMHEVSAETLRHIVSHLAQSSSNVDLVHFGNQPRSWQGYDNPLLALPHHDASDCAFAATLGADFDLLLRERRGKSGRKKMRWQQNTLAPVGGYRIIHARTTEEAHRILDAFCAQKATRFDSQGIRNVFADDGVMEFLHYLADAAIASDTPSIELFGLEIEGKIRATYAGGIASGRFSGFFNSIATDEYTRVSPGELLLNELIRFCCERGLDTFDLGIGEARYKAAWCDIRESLFDTFVPITARGRIDALMFGSMLRVKRSIKQNPRLWALALSMRKTLHSTHML